jgi:hypothetical protein
MSCSTVAGLLGLVLYRFRRVPKSCGMVLGLFSAMAGLAGLFFFVFFAGDVATVAWLGVLTPFALGVMDLLLWQRSRA